MKKEYETPVLHQVEVDYEDNLMMSGVKINDGNRDFSHWDEEY